MIVGAFLLITSGLTPPCPIVELPMVKAPGFGCTSSRGISLDEEANVNKGLRVDLKVTGVDGETPTFNDEGMVMGVEEMPPAPSLVLLDLGEILCLEGEHGMMRAFTSGVVVPGFNTMSAAGATRPSWCLYSSTGK